jgi:hypothetical protein
MLMAICALGADGLEACLQRAGGSSGANYVRQREEALRRGHAILPDLKKAAVDVKLTSQQRLVARIWVEWLERSSQIESLRHYDWEKHPKFTPELLGSHIGPWFKMMPFIIDRFKEQRLWYYYCESAVLRTEENWTVARDYDWLLRRWGGAAWGALQSEPEFYYCVAWMREVLRADVELRTELARIVFHSFEIEKIPDGIPELLKSFFSMTAIEETKHGMQPRGRIQHLLHLIKMAGPQHAALFDDFILGHPEFAALKPVVDELRKKPPVKEWEEPPYNPGHESESLKADVSKP